MDGVKLAAIVTARPSYSRIREALFACQHRGVDVTVIACASALLERYGKVVDIIREDGFHVEEVWSTYEGANRLTSAKETGALTTELSGVLRALWPDLALVVADRHEVLGAAQAAAYLHLPLLHIQGGERTGSIDDRVRDSISHLADYHAVATARAKARVYGLTGDLEHIWVTGCPSIDIARQAIDSPPVTWDEIGGVGATFPLDQPFVVFLQHPVTSEDGIPQIEAALRGVSAVGVPVLACWPGQDAGSEAMSKVLRENQYWLHTFRNLPPERFLRLLTQSACLVGNSSVGIRECSYLGVPVVNIGSRQRGRERAGNVRDVPECRGDLIAVAVLQQVMAGRYPSSTLYGDGYAADRIGEVISGLCVDTCAQRK